MFLDELDRETAEDIINKSPPAFDPADTTVIFLDQNKWGNLHEGRHDPESPYRDTYETVAASANNGTAVYPFSLVRQAETDEHPDLRFRRELYELMLDLSRNICFKNYFLVTKAERRAYITGCIPGQTVPDITDDMFDRGLVSPLGMPRVKGIPKEDNEMLHRLLRSERVSRLMIHDDDYLTEAAKFQQQIDEQDLQKREDVRQRSKELGDTDEERWNILVARNLAQNFFPLLYHNAQQVDLNIQRSVHQDLREYGFDLEEFLAQFPAYYCQFVLSHGRDFHWDREIEANDLEDMMSLAAAIPYSDVVVTEEFFAGVAYKHDLHERFNTTILTDITDIKGYLTDH
ncbi:hypothetical protein [Natrialba sp. PRR66]|uniref:hypothetical protein n=1 Tax=Natrialba sp. PRR66 TaxID=3098146 RepID=UPI002B1D8475|nr:hypothetical protein [Natrialba sp. PRR66]